MRLPWASKAGWGGGQRGRVLSSWKVRRGRPPEASEVLLFQNCKKCFELHIIQLYSRNTGRKVYLGRWFRACHPPSATQKSVGFGPIPPTPLFKSLWRSAWPLPSLFRTNPAVQSCDMERCIAADRATSRLSCSSLHILRSRFLTAIGGQLLDFYQVRLAADGLKIISTSFINLP